MLVCHLKEIINCHTHKLSNSHKPEVLVYNMLIQQINTYHKHNKYSDEEQFNITYVVPCRYFVVTPSLIVNSG